MKDNYLHSLVGRAVQVYRGGPDSNSGKLLDVSNDYLALQIEDGTVIYYKTSHLKSVQEDPHVIFSSVTTEDEDSNESETLLKAGNFNELATQFLNQPVRINGSGPESREGTVIDVQGDFIILYTKEDGLLFYNNQHIKSLSVPIKEKKNEEDTENEENSENADEENSGNDQEESEQELLNTVLASYDQIAAESLNDLLMNLKYSWIKINRKGPESVEGLLIEIHDDHLVLAVDNQIFRIVLYHVKNFSVKINNSENEKNQKSNDDSSNTDNSNDQNSNNNNSNNKNSNNQNSDNQNSNNKNSNNEGRQSKLSNQQEQKLKERAEYIERRKIMKMKKRR